MRVRLLYLGTSLSPGDQGSYFKNFLLLFNPTAHLLEQDSSKGSATALLLVYLCAPHCRIKDHDSNVLCKRNKSNNEEEKTK